MFNIKDQKIVCLFTPGPIGGAEKVVAGGLRALQAKGMNVSLWIIKEERVPHVTQNFIKLLESEGVPYRIFSSRGIFDSQLMLQLKQAFKKESPAIIHTHGFKAAFYGQFAKTKTSQLIITHHGKTSHTLKVKIYEWIELFIMKKANAVVAVSEDMRGTLFQSGVEKHKIHVAENLMTSKVCDKQGTREEKLKLLFVGRLSPEKGCNVLLEALKLIPNKKFTLSVLGDGIQRAKLEAEGSDIQFLGFQNNVVEIMAQHDVLVMPSLREGLPLTLIEACCIGMPVVASKVGGIPELISDGINGFLCRPGDTQQLSKALIELDTKFERLRLASNFLKDHYTKRFSPENWADKSIDIYQMVLSQ